MKKKEKWLQKKNKSCKFYLHEKQTKQTK